LKRAKPQFIYVHLGINDIQSGTAVTEVVENHKIFIESVERYSPTSTIIISCPLLNGNSYHDRHVFSLRHTLTLLVNNIQGQSDNPSQRKLHIQKNNKFFISTKSTRIQNPRYFQKNDRLHLSEKGKFAMISCMRATMESILKELQHEL
jgi:lysophospholipase L1-like esterase